MKLHIKKNIKEYCSFMEQFKNVGKETVMVLTNTGLHIQVIGGGIIAMSLDFKPDFFDVFEFEGEQEKIKVAISDITFPIKNSNEATIESDGEKLYIKGDKDEFTAPVFHIEPGDEKQFPQLEYEFNTTIESDNLKNAYNKLKNMKPSCVTFYTKEGKMLIEGESSLRKYIVELGESEEYEGKTSIGFEFLEKVLMKENRLLNLYVKGNEAPLTLKYFSDNLEMVYIIAPRV